MIQAYLPAAQLHAQFEAVEALSRERVVTSCGGGIAASSDVLVLTLLGVPNVAVYDGGLLEWAADPALPLTTGPSRQRRDVLPGTALSIEPTVTCAPCVAKHTEL